MEPISDKFLVAHGLLGSSCKVPRDLATGQLVVRVEKGRQLQGSAAEIAALLGKSDVGQRVVRASGGGGFCYNYRSSSNCYRLKSLCS